MYDVNFLNIYAYWTGCFDQTNVRKKGKDVLHYVRCRFEIHVILIM